MTPTAKISPALQALLHRVIDYAGSFPPASLPCRNVIENYQQYQAGPHAWMLRWLVVNSADVAQIPESLTGKLSVLSEAAVPQAVCVESKSIVQLGVPVYAEVPWEQLAAVKEAGIYAKIRTGGVKPEAIPSVEEVARFLLRCADLKLAFKATAGLHHALRGKYRLTYEPNSPLGTMHGFLNVFLAAAFAWHGERDILPILEETEYSAFHFDEKAHWRNRSLNTTEITEAREQFIHAFGSCSFVEPVEELQARGWTC